MTAYSKFSALRFFLGFVAGITTTAIAILVSVMFWGDRFLENINNLYLTL